MAYDARVCEKIHERVDERLDTQEKRLNSHSERLDRLEQNQSEFKTEIKNLCENLKSLTSILRWFIGIWVTSLLGFFFFILQNKLK